MTVITSGAITVGPKDLQVSYRGAQIAIKVRADFGIIVACELINGAWQGVRDLIMFDMDNVGSVETELAKAGGAVAWVKTVLVPLINAWLAERFKPVAAPAPGPAPAPSGDPYVDIDAAIFALKWLPAADGTLKVSA
jgi:hypothetical protein